MKTHFTWSIEDRGRCPFCGREPVLIVAKAWDTADDDRGQPIPELFTDEVTAHQCVECNRLVSMSLNTTPH